LKIGPQICQSYYQASNGLLFLEHSVYSAEQYVPQTSFNMHDSPSVHY